MVQDAKQAAGVPKKEDLPPGMTEMKADWVRRLFECYDEDGSGYIDVNEFHAILLNMDPEITFDGVQHMFKECGVKDGLMDCSKLYVWAMKIFGDASDEEFAQYLKEMIISSPKYQQ